MSLGTVLARERNKRDRLVEIEQAGGKELREEVFASDGHWQQRGSESSRRGAIMEHAARLQLDAQLAADGIKPVGAAGPDGAPAPVTYHRLTHQRGGGGFDDIVVIFSGPPDRPQAFRSRRMHIELVLGPTTKVGREGTRGSSVVTGLRAEMRSVLGADVLRPTALGVEPVDRVEAVVAEESEP